MQFSALYLLIYILIYPPVAIGIFQVLRNTFGITPLYRIHQYYSPVTLHSLA